MLRLFLLVVGFLKLAESTSSYYNHCAGGDDSQSPYSIIIDGGSTGSRLHIFRFVQSDHGEQNEEDSCICLREGSRRAEVPLSSFGPAKGEKVNATQVAAHLLPLFEYAADLVPSRWHHSTLVQYQATAGMRLLSQAQQTAVYDALYQGLFEADSFVFRGMQRSDIQTLSGDLEGYYGAVAANYLSGRIDANLHLISPPQQQVEDNHNNPHHHQYHPIGALDMGGSSTQIVYLTEQIDNGSHNCSIQEAPDGEQEQLYTPQTCPKPKLQEEHFFSTSYLSYGVDQFRERLWNALILDYSQQLLQTANHHDACESKIVPNPCGFKGYQLEWDGYTLIGTGDADECTRQIQRLLPHPQDALDDHHQHTGRTVGGIHHPPVRGRFLAMSLFFFTLDSLRVLSHPHAEAHTALNQAWPTPTLDELTHALKGLCSRQWKDDVEHDAHDFTRPHVLPHRCFESVYLVTLLRDGFGFHPQSRDIEFTFLVDGSEVEWSLGMALSLFSSKNSRNSSTTTVTTTTIRDRSSEEEDGVVTRGDCSEEHRNATAGKDERTATVDLESPQYAAVVAGSG